MALCDFRNVCLAADAFIPSLIDLIRMNKNRDSWVNIFQKMEECGFNPLFFLHTEIRFRSCSYMAFALYYTSVFRIVPAALHPLVAFELFLD